MDQRSLSLLGIVCWLLAVACTAAVFWLAFGVASPAKESAAKAREELMREHTQSEAVMSQALAAAMFAGDYSEAQDLLTRYAATGYFTRAVVTNSEQRVVASVGSTPGLAVGNPLPEGIAADSRLVKLLLRSEDYGKLVVLEAQQSAAAAALLETRVGTLYNALRALAWAALTLASCLTLFLALHWRRHVPRY